MGGSRPQSRLIFNQIYPNARLSLAYILIDHLDRFSPGTPIRLGPSGQLLNMQITSWTSKDCTSLVDKGPNAEGVVVLGNSSNFWLWDENSGFDLTHPDTPTADPVTPRIELEAYNARITIAPQKTALVVVDFTNLLALAPPDNKHAAEETTLKYAVPAARQAGIQVVWINWGLTDSDLKNLNPTTERIHAFQPNGMPQLDKGFGHDMGLRTTADGEEVQAGRFLVQHQWNTRLHGPSEVAYQQGLQTSLPDKFFYKNRISGMYDAESDCIKFLTQAGIRTLLFAGCNTDVCVSATLQDASLINFDCVLLADGTATNNGEKAQWATERNCRKGWGFVSSCKALHEGVDGMRQ